MKNIRPLSLLLILTLLLTLLLPAAMAVEDTAPGGAEPPASDVSGGYAASGPAHTVLAKAALLIELNTDQVLLEQNADVQVYPASLTKIMTCMLTLEHGSLSDVVTVSETALQNLSEAGSTAGLQAGEQLTLKDLLYCMMLSSANEACNVAAEYVSGSVDAFVELMNQEAAALGCTGTHFANPHGLHDENHYTTARDLSLIAKEALKSETFKTITSTVSYEVPATNLSGPRALSTTNLLETPGSRYYYEYAAGIKTGFTTPAGRCLISTAERPDSKLRLLSVVCGAEDVILDTGEIENQNFTETKALFEYGFDNFAYATVLKTIDLTSIPVLMSAGSDEAVLAPSQDLTALLPIDFDETQLQKEIRLSSPGGVEAPIAKNQVLGTVTVTYRGQVLGTADLVAITDTARSQAAAQAASTKSFLANHWWKLLLVLLLLFIGLYLVVASVNRSRRRKRRQQQRMRRKQRGEVIEFPGRRREEDEE